jgi:hypothetical protein
MMLPTRRSVLAAPAWLPLLAQENAAGPPEHHLLSAGLAPDRLATLLEPRAKWAPYPRAADRAAWQALPADARASLVDSAAKTLGKPWASLPASVFLDFRRNGNRSRFEDIHFARRNRLRGAALAECVEQKGRFLDDILDGLWLICEESFWGVPAHMSAQKAGSGLPDVDEPIVDLFAAETANAVAWVDYLLGAQLESLSPLLRPRLRSEIERRILTPLRTRIDFGWMGLNPKHPQYVNNWNPWINSNWLTCALLLEDEPRRSATVQKILTSLDRFLDGYHPDGGCDEGPSYWSRAGASLFDCLELVHSATAGRLNLFTLPLVGQIGAYIYRAHIAGDWYVNFADASARVVPDANLVWRYGRRVGDARLAAHGAWIAAQHPPAAAVSGALGAMGRALDTLFHMKELREAAPAGRPALVRDVALPGIQVFAARMEEGSTRGFYIAAQGGHNAESHNHNDVGNFIVYHDGEPVLIDIGVETYTAKTFSKDRYTIWTMQSGWHNCPTINGVEQAAGRQYAARQFTPGAGSLSLDIAAAYPAETGVTRWQRTLRLDRAAGAVLVTDDYELSRAESVEFSLITTCQPIFAAPGGIKFPEGFVITFDPDFEVLLDQHPVEDAHLRPIWGQVVRRVRLRRSRPALKGHNEMRMTKP